MMTLGSWSSGPGAPLQQKSEQDLLFPGFFNLPQTGKGEMARPVGVMFCEKDYLCLITSNPAIVLGLHLQG